MSSIYIQKKIVTYKFLTQFKTLQLSIYVKYLQLRIYVFTKLIAKLKFYSRRSLSRLLLFSSFQIFNILLSCAFKSFGGWVNGQTELNEKRGSYTHVHTKKSYSITIFDKLEKPGF